MNDSFWFTLLQTHHKSGDNDEYFRIYIEQHFKYALDYDFERQKIEPVLKNMEKIIFLNKNSSKNNYYCLLVKDIQNIIINHLTHGIPYYRLLIFKEIIDKIIKRIKKRKKYIKKHKYIKGNKGPKGPIGYSIW